MDELIPLEAENLSRLSARLRVPEYDRTELSPGILHIGVGNFHRAHQAWYLHRLFETGKDRDWAVMGAGVRAYDVAQREKILAQDGLYTLVELNPDGQSAEVCGSILDYVPVEPANGPLIAAMSDPAIRIVSLTVTEGGYYQTVDGSLDLAHEDLIHDAANPAAPRTAFGAIIAALADRRRQGHAPFTCLSCDNLLGNGIILRQTVVGLARATDPDLADWIDAQGAFPNSMVDCIVPATGPSEIAAAAAFGLRDAVPVTHENFRQWVIEDNFACGRPSLEDVGVTFTDDVHGYETLKLRILNAGHQIIAMPAEILGIETIAETMVDPDISALMTKVLETDVLPLLSPVADYTPAEYLAMVKTRFENPGIADTTRRVAFDGTSRQTGFVLPSVRDALSRGTSITGLALSVALWARYCFGARENGSVVEANDPFWADLMPVAAAAKESPAAWLAQSQFFGELASATRFADAFAAWLTRLYDAGTRETIQSYLKGETP